MSTIFIIRPFNVKQDASGRDIDFERVHAELIAPALEQVERVGQTTGEILDSGNIREDMFSLILEADVVIADISVHNANVFYELGIRHAFRKRTTIMIRADVTADRPPFDIATDRYVQYRLDDLAGSVDALVASLRASEASDRPTDSPVFQLLPALEESDPAQVTVVPLDFTEEVARAKAARAKGWLRLLAQEVAGRRFGIEGLRIVARAQWALQDFPAARRNWEAVLEARRGDIEAELALANVYERLHRGGDATALAKSNQAIDRVLGGSPDRRQRAEALSLQGRNLKSRWRERFEAIDDLAERRHEAMNRALRASFDAYLAAFNVDLNQYWPGLAALQSGTILRELSVEESWPDAFDSDEEAEAARAQLEATVERLQSLVEMSVGNALATGHDDMWAKITRADVMFLTTSERVRRVIDAYDDAIPATESFAWGSVKGQLALFRCLGVKADLADAIISKLDSKMGEDATTKTHLVVFAGHRLDEPGRATPRFPAAAEASARACIEAAIDQVDDPDYELRAIVSAAPGADIVALEAFVDRGITTSICLPMPPEDFAREQFLTLDDWRSRYLELVDQHETMVLSDRPGLPRWLQPTDIDAWERGNEWVVKIAEAWGADRTTAIVLWDGVSGDGPGGTAHLVDLVRSSGKIRVVRIDTRELLDATAAEGAR